MNPQCRYQSYARKSCLCPAGVSRQKPLCYTGSIHSGMDQAMCVQLHLTWYEFGSTGSRTVSVDLVRDRDCMELKEE